jgi:uncharacterized protein YyaL (SSP411 family)
MIKKYIVLLLSSTLYLLASNHLSHETSPYLLQHKDNPVDWYAWNKEAFTKAKKEKKLIFLSIGYSTCHWCHVMAKESFENQKVATLLNKYFISIKVDKEQYPHIDQYYQKIYRIMHHKGGGWPLTIILTSDMKPLFSATYIPKDSGYGSQGLINILNQIIKIPQQKLEKYGNNINQQAYNNQNKQTTTQPLDKQLENKTIKQFGSYFDFKYNGFSIAPKFPHASSIDLLLKLYQITKNPQALKMATLALDSMAKGGIYDQIEGGFFRYSVDQRWEIPHFEKMLYTNAELISSYTQAYNITHNPLYKKVVINTIAQMDKRFEQQHLYKSASNADSVDHNQKEAEGFYFLFDYFKVYNYLKRHNIDEKTIKNSLEYLGINQDGNFDGELSNTHITNDHPPKSIDKIIKLLAQYRTKKSYPFIDYKINTAWNALYIKAKFQASIFDKRYIQEAIVSLDVLLDTMFKNNTLYHQTILKVQPTQKALLEDYSFLASCVFEAYEVTLNKKYFKIFSKLVQNSIKIFYKNKRWFTSNDLLKIYANIDEGGYKNSLATNLMNILKYATLEANNNYIGIVKQTLQQFSSQLNQYPSYYPTALKTDLMLKYSPIFIKSNKTNLNKIDINSIDYPFLYRYVYDTKLYLACKINSCFSNNLNFNIVKKDIINQK